MKGKEMLYAMNYVNQIYVEEAAWKTGAGGRKSPYIRYFAAAACLCLALLGVFRLGVTPGGKPPAIDLPPAPVTTQTPEPTETADPVEPPRPQQVTILWEGVKVNEIESMLDAARLWRDPEIYDEEKLDTDGVREYYGWELAPAYVPEGFTGGGHGAWGWLVREKATGEVVEDHAGRSFGVAFWEDGGTKSDDDIVIPRDFTVSATRSGFLRCAILPLDSTLTTDFGGVAVTIGHCSLPYGPFDPTRRDPSGLYNMPAGYYDIYTANFTLEGVEYEVETRRLEAEEIIKIVASMVRPYGDITVGANGTD